MAVPTDVFREMVGCVRQRELMATVCISASLLTLLLVTRMHTVSVLPPSWDVGPILK